MFVCVCMYVCVFACVRVRTIMIEEAIRTRSNKTVVFIISSGHESLKPKKFPKTQVIIITCSFIYPSPLFSFFLSFCCPSCSTGIQFQENLIDANDLKQINCPTEVD